MTKILFICLGNICRSTMAEALLKYHLEQEGIQAIVQSRGTSSEERGNPPYHLTKQLLTSKNIDPEIYLKGKVAEKLSEADCHDFDYILCMDKSNLEATLAIAGPENQHKVMLLSNLIDQSYNVADPWYTRDFDATYKDIMKTIPKLIELCS